MLKSILIPLSLLLLYGCSLTPEKVTSLKVKKTEHTMFQTVPKKKAVILQKGKNKEYCHVCGMKLAKFYKTNHAANENGVEHQYCSLRCLAKDIHDGAELENPQVVDVHSLKFIPVLEAYYVVGSNVKGTMSRVSKYAFKSLKDAKAFQAKHGGKIVDFHSAWETAKKDFK